MRQRSERSSNACRRSPAATYELFADLVHATGVSETVTGQIETAGIQGVPLSGDDSAWSANRPSA